LVRLAGHHATGSSIMPQKRNPDGAELVRGKAAVVLGHLQTLLVLVKGLPLAYNRDLQEERHAIFDGVLQTTASVRMMAAMWRDLIVNRNRFESELVGDPSLATELADLLTARGVPFRKAHEAVGRAARWCEEQGGDLSLLDGGRAREFHPELPDDLGQWLDPRSAVERRQSRGGSAPAEIARQVAVLRARIDES
jgi:argininosuccinate lyase